MAARIEATPAADPVRFVVAGDSGAWPDADGGRDALRAAPGRVDDVVVGEDAEGPRVEDLAFLDHALRGAEPNRVVLMHMPPHMDGHYAPHEDWGFRPHEDDFFALLAEHRVRLVCCAHGLAFDYRGTTTEGDGRPEDRGALFHAVELELAAADRGSDPSSTDRMARR